MGDGRWAMGEGRGARGEGRGARGEGRGARGEGRGARGDKRGATNDGQTTDKRQTSDGQATDKRRTSDGRRLGATYLEVPELVWQRHVRTAVDEDGQSGHVDRVERRVDLLDGRS